MSGLAVINEMRERRPDFPIVAISGMAALDAEASPELSNVICLQKPFRPNELVRAIDAAIMLFQPPVGSAADLEVPIGFAATSS